MSSEGFETVKGEIKKAFLRGIELEGRKYKVFLIDMVPHRSDYIELFVKVKDAVYTGYPCHIPEKCCGCLAKAFPVEMEILGRKHPLVVQSFEHNDAGVCDMVLRVLALPQGGITI